jgi:hypothetical protein
MGREGDGLGLGFSESSLRALSGLFGTLSGRSGNATRTLQVESVVDQRMGVTVENWSYTVV